MKKFNLLFILLIAGSTLFTQKVNAQPNSKSTKYEEEKASPEASTKFALLVRIEAKPGKEAEVSKFLNDALPLAQAENGTVRWYALKIGTSTFGIFDTFQSEDGRTAHLQGKIATALMARKGELLSKEPTIERVEIIALK